MYFIEVSGASSILKYFLQLLNREITILVFLNNLISGSYKAVREGQVCDILNPLRLIKVFAVLSFACIKGSGGRDTYSHVSVAIREPKT